MTRILFIAFITVVLLASCGHQSPKTQDGDPTDSVQVSADSTGIEAEEAETLPVAADELFDDFIFNFAANSKLQKNRIKFPLPEQHKDKTKTLTKAQWKMDYFFMRQDYYTLIFGAEQEMEEVKSTGINEAVLEKIYFNNDAVKRYVFQRERGRWYLVRIYWSTIAQSHNASFLTFYKRFATDTEFQMESLNETVSFVGPDPDDDFSQMEGVITADSWPAFAPQLPAKMIYNIVYGHPKEDQDDKIFVIRGIANGLEMQLRFHRSHDKWRLHKMIT